MSNPEVVDTAYFLDNDQHAVNTVASCGSHVHCRKVRGKDRYPNLVSYKSKLFKEFFAKLSPDAKEYAQALRIVSFMYGGENGLFLDKGSGIQKDDIVALKHWVVSNTGKKLAVLIDYDRTLTEIEGILLFEDTFAKHKKLLEKWMHNHTLTTKVMVEYYAGGEERLKMIQEMFDFLYATPNLDVYILTNNPTCHWFPEFFDEIINVFTSNRKFKKLCANLYDNNKKTAIQAQNFLSKVCPQKQKTRKVLSRKRQTRKK